ncbi:tyrosine-type recombinase/integrase [Tranquillimonas alkanivorans]|uniref:Phage integrase family protein n=1 Tax=Tranquillimonas alkanivorans TaxID=441119 RepID=A0A1I5MEP8_9RHOB|nr:tyrosine-type recombinase/integrase [Tranquillimonas alkanivorans]SFP08000.1 Phage integrase family protein [Tranquillimonas alkanivorans]
MHHTETAAQAPVSVAQISREVVRHAVSRIMTESCDPGFDAEERLQAVEDLHDILKQEIRQKAFSTALPLAMEAAQRLGAPCPVPMPPEFGRAVSTTLKSLCRIEIDVYEDGEDVIEAASGLLSRHGISVTDGKIAPLLRISDARDAALQGATEEMRRKLKATAALVLEFLGDIPLELLPGQVESLMVQLSRLPKHHGQQHGKNRYEKEGRSLSKREAIALADLADEQNATALRDRRDLSDAQRRAMLAERLTKRVTHTNLERHLDRLHQMLREAEKKLGYAGKTKLLTYAELAKTMKADAERRRKQDPLFIRATQPKIRLRWAGARIKTLLTSPLYRGCSSLGRRTNPGRLIFRDAKYWVPLIMVTMGTRVTEVLQAKKCDLLLRDGVHCLRLCWSAEQDGKTVSSTRFVPIPQVLLDLGFVEWVRDRGDDPSTLLFPEIIGANPDRPDQIFTKQMLTIRKGLGIKDYNEDLYALRKTLSSALWKGGVNAEDRQMIIGHVSDTTIGKHYTEADLAALKTLLDKADHGIVVTRDTAHRFPVIADCTLISGVPARLDIVLDDHGNLGAVRVLREHDGHPLLALAIDGAALPAFPQWDGLEVASRAAAPEMVADLLVEYHILTPGTPACRDAWEHFIAMAADGSEGKVCRRNTK